MSPNGIKPQPPQGGAGAKPATPPPQQIKPQDTSIFGGQPCLKMEEAGRRLEKGPLDVPGFTQKFTKPDIKKLTDELKKDYGPFLKPQDRPRILRDWELKTSKAQGAAKFQRIKEYNFLKRGLLGK